MVNMRLEGAPTQLKDAAEVLSEFEHGFLAELSALKGALLESYDESQAEADAGWKETAWTRAVDLFLATRKEWLETFEEASREGEAGQELGYWEKFLKELDPEKFSPQPDPETLHYLDELLSKADMSTGLAYDGRR